MEINLTRRWKGENSTLSTITVDGAAHHFALEDTDRGLDSARPDTIKEKQYGITAIPTGRYRVIISYSNRFRRQLPFLLNVPGFSGIRIHPGNRHINTLGCILPGITYWKDGQDFVVGTSRIASEKLQTKIAAAISRNEAVWINITSKLESNDATSTH